MGNRIHNTSDQIIADLRRQLAASNAARDEALGREAAVAEMLHVINSSPGDLTPVFDAMLDKALRLCEAAFGTLWIRKDDGFHYAAQRGVPATLDEVLRGLGPIQPETASPLARMAEGEPYIQFPDVAAQSSENPSGRRSSALVDLGGARTTLWVALRKGGEVLGIIHIYRQEVRPFTDQQIALLQSFAAQAVIAMENARLITETREALEQQTATAEVLGIINSSPGDLNPVFDGILEKAHILCGVDHGALTLFDGEHFRAVATRGYNEQFAEVLRRPFRPTAVHERLLGGERYVHFADAMALAAGMDDALGRNFFQHAGLHTLLHIPLRRDNTLIGYITAARSEIRPFAEKEIALLENFAAQAVVAMENARLITETREALEQQTATAEVLGVINSSPGDLAPVFDAMLEKAIRLCDGVSGVLWTLNGERARLAGSRGVSSEIVESLRQQGESGSHPLLRRVISGEHLLRLDLAEDELYRSSKVAAGGDLIAFGVRTVTWVALAKDGAAVGAFVIGRLEVRPFSDREIALLQNFAAQAVIAMENARLLTETREALAQQTATAEVLGVINSSPGDLTPVFDAILEKAHTLCGAAQGALSIYDGEYSRAVATRGLLEPSAELLRRGIDAHGSPLVEPLLAGEGFVHIADMAEIDHPGARAAAELNGTRTLLSVPLRKDGALLGMIVANRQEVRPFTDKQIALLQNFAAQAVIAMENARLITETREALEQQTDEVLQVINASPGELTPVFDAILEKAHGLCGATLGSLRLYDGKNIRAVALRGHPEAFADELRRGYPLADALGARLLAGELVHILDSAEVDHPMARKSFEQIGTRTILVVPLRKEGALLGMIFAGRTEVRPFTDKQIALLQNFAAQAVIAMENARLITETREALEQQTATAEVLGVINSSPGDLAPVFDAMLKKAVHLCEAAYGVLLTYDGEGFSSVALHNVPPAFADFLVATDGLVPPANSRTGFGRLVAGDDCVQFLDVATDDAYTNTGAGGRALVELGGARTTMLVALRKEGALLGAISAYRTEVREFSEKQIAVFRNFADQAVIAMENARLLGELHQRTEEVAELNRGLEARVAEQVDELGRVGRLKRFLAPQLAELIVSQGDEKILESHRREIVVVFCDLRGYTAFTETAEPEEVLDFLREYHGALGPLVAEYEGTLDQFSGDGIMVFFNDPVPIPDPAERAVKMAVAMREEAGTLIATWRRRDRELGFGVGIAQGYATLGQIGFAERSGYTAIGTVCNLASRLCAEAKDRQILISGRVAAAVEKAAPLEDLGSVALKGLSQPVSAFNVPLTASQPALRVIEGGPQNG